MKANNRLEIKRSIPTRGSVFGHNYNDNSVRDIEYTDMFSSSDIMLYFRTRDYYGNYTDPDLGINSVIPIRVLKPHYGYITACNLDLLIKLDPIDSDITLRIGVGEFSNNTLFIPKTSYTENEKIALWEKLSGSITPITTSNNELKLENLRITSIPDTPRQGFVLVLFFSRAPIQTSNFSIKTFNLITSVTGAV